MIDCTAIIVTPNGFDITAYSTDGTSIRGTYLRGGDDYQSIGAKYEELKAFCGSEALVQALCNIVHPTSELAEALRNQKEKQG